MLKQNFKEYNNNLKKDNFSFFKNSWNDKNFIDRYLFESLLKTSNKIKNINIYQYPSGPSFNLNNNKFQPKSIINRNNINSLSIFSYNNFLKNKQNYYKLNYVNWIHLKKKNFFHNLLLKSKIYHNIKWEELSSIKGYINLNVKNFSNNNSTLTNHLKNKITINIGSYLTTLSYKKIIFEQRELFQIRKIYNEHSGKKTYIFNLLKNFCQYIYSANELNDNNLFKTHLNRLNSKFKYISINLNNVFIENEDYNKQKYIKSNNFFKTKKVLTKILKISKYVKFKDIFKILKKKHSCPNVKNNKNSFLFLNKENDKENDKTSELTINENKNINLKKKINYENWGKYSFYTYKKNLNQNNINYLNTNTFKHDINQINLYKYLHNIFFSNMDNNFQINQNLTNLNKYLNQLDFENISNEIFLKNNQKNINYITWEQINGYLINETNIISSGLLCKLHNIQNQLNINKNNKTFLTHGFTKKNLDISEIASIFSEKIYLIPFDEKNQSEINKNDDIFDQTHNNTELNVITNINFNKEIKDEKLNKDTYISLTYLLLLLNRLIHKKSIKFIFCTKNMYASIFYLKYYWLYLYNHFFPTFQKTNEQNSIYENAEYDSEETLKNIKEIKHNLENKHKKILHSNLHVQYLKSRYYFKIINSNFLKKKNLINTNEIYTKFNINTNKYNNNENSIEFIKESTEKDKEQNLLNETNQYNLVDKNLINLPHSWNSNYTKKLITLLIYKKKLNIKKNSNLEMEAKNCIFNNIILNTSSTNQNILINTNRNKLTILQTDTLLYNSVDLIDLSF